MPADCPSTPDTENREGAPIYALSGQFQRVLNAPALLLMGERLLLYSLVLGMQPRRVLEIGTNLAGAAAIIAAAMDETGSPARIVTLDPNPRHLPSVQRSTAHRLTSLQGTSPADIPRAVDTLGGKPDLIFIDGNHEYHAVRRDFEQSLACTAPGGCLLFHDAHYWQVAQAIRDVLRDHPAQLADAGILTAAKAHENRTEDGHPVAWGGLHLIRLPGPPA